MNEEELKIPKRWRVEYSATHLVLGSVRHIGYVWAPSVEKARNRAQQMAHTSFPAGDGWTGCGWAVEEFSRREEMDEQRREESALEATSYSTFLVGLKQGFGAVRREDGSMVVQTALPADYIEFRRLAFGASRLTTDQ